MATYLSSNMTYIQQGVGEKMGGLISSFGRCIVGLAMAFYFGWELALVVLVFIGSWRSSVIVLSAIPLALLLRYMFTPWGGTPETAQKLLDQVTARAVSALSKLVPLCAPLLQPGGEMLFMKGARVAEEVTAAEKALRKARVRDHDVLVLGEGTVPEATRVFRASLGH